MSFQSMRARASDLIDRMLKQLEEKEDPYSPQEAGVLEKCVKIMDVIDAANGRTGKETGLEKMAVDDLEALFDEE